MQEIQDLLYNFIKEITKLFISIAFSTSIILFKIFILAFESYFSL